MNKELFSLIVFLAWSAVVGAAPLDRRPDFLIKDDLGNVIKRGGYTTGASGEVLRYDLFSEDTKDLLHSELPVYDPAGKIALVRVFEGNGLLKLIIVMTDSGHVTIDPEGNLLNEKQSEIIYRSDYTKKGP